MGMIEHMSKDRDQFKQLVLQQIEQIAAVIRTMPSDGAASSVQPTPTDDAQPAPANIAEPARSARQV
jgi:hypothetical protein